MEEQEQAPAVQPQERRRFKGVIDCSLLHRPDHFLFHFFPYGSPSHSLALPLSLSRVLSHSFSPSPLLSLFKRFTRSFSLPLSLFLLRQRDWFTGWQGRRCPGAAKQWLTTGHTFNEPLWRVSGVASSGWRLSCDSDLSGFLSEEIFDRRELLSPS